MIRALRTTLKYHQKEFASILQISEEELRLIENEILVPDAATMNLALEFERSFNEGTLAFVKSII